MRMIFLIVIPIMSMLWYMLQVPGRSYRGPMPAMTQAQLALAAQLSLHVHAIGAKEHNTGHPEALKEVAAYIQGQLDGIGYAVAVQAFPSADQTVQNLEVEIKGSARPDEIVVIGAHYDSAHGSPGANDNGSGTAMVLELARSFKERRPQRTLRFVFFTNEEPPHFGTATMGSRVYANRSRARGDRITAMLSLETVGYYDDAAGSQRYPNIFSPFFPDSGNFLAFVGDLRSRELVHQSIATFRAARQFPSEAIATFPWIKGINWSDHSAFWNNGYPAMMMTDTATFRYPYYHSSRDTPDKVNYQRMAQLFAGVDAVVGTLAGVPNQ
jgi:Zn-dependent M28 family amino/carboxypeptidase